MFNSPSLAAAVVIGRTSGLTDWKDARGRLLREVRIQEEVYLTLKTEFEMVKIEEVKSLPMIRILDEAVAPINKSKPKRRRIMTIAVFIGLILGVIVAFGEQYFRELFTNEKQATVIRRITTPLIEDYIALKKYVKKG